MKSSLVALLIVTVTITASGCGNDNKGQTQNDLSMAMDLGGPPRDLSMSTKNGCNGLNTCEANCNSGDQPCLDSCTTNATTKASTLYNAALTCGQDWCLAMNDLGAPRCMLDASMNLVDPTGGPAGSCNNCLLDATAMLNLPPTCVTPNGPDCNPAMCTAPQMACLADLP